MSETPSSGDAPLDSAFAELEPGFLAGNGRFTLIRLIGRGGMGVVWLARDESLREEVALKFLPPEIRYDAVALDDLRRETARSRKLTHPNIVRIHDLCKDEREAFISMEYVDGPNLSDLRLEHAERVFTWKFLEPLVKQLCEALDYAHGEKVVHRDLKPANMMLDSRGRLKLSDFGIAAQVSDSVSRVSMLRHSQSGTSTYMSPQQMDGKLPQISDDIYALGATLYELLTSRAPFFTGDIPHQVRNFLPQPIDERLAELDIVNDVPRPVAAMIMACLAKFPEQRPTSARVVAEWIGLQPAPPPQMATSVITHATPEPIKRAESPPISLAAPSWNTESPTPEPSTAITRFPRWLTFARIPAVIIFGLGLGLVAWWFVTHRVGDKGNSSAVAETNIAPAPRTPVNDPFVSLFSGRDLTGWSGDSAVWTVRGDVIHGSLARRSSSEASCLFWTGEVPDDFELRFSFRLMSGNSGVFYRANAVAGFGAGGYQFDILPDRPGNLLESGSDRMRRMLFRVPASVAPIPAGSWHEAAVIVRGGRIQHVLDGQVLVDLVDSYDKRPLSGLLGLEATGGNGATEVEFKDLRLKRASAGNFSPPATADWVPLFDGRSLGPWEGWKGADWRGSWEMLNGELRSLRAAKVNLATREQFGDFELELEWKVAPGANSGIFYRVPPDAADLPKAAPEFQVVDDATRDGRTPITAAGSIYRVVAPANKQLRSVGSFNTTRIVVRGRQAEHWLNGVQVLSADLDSPAVRRVAVQRYSRNWGEAAQGQIVLQNLGMEVSFRNIRIRRLD